mmetsp:Transcript_22144/g.36419  ORF Transcript_22144/g.36419 Transcript_22144/m.36419 type:complete len:105 (+) Transcript_22144:256-570(+)
MFGDVGMDEILDGSNVCINSLGGLLLHQRVLTPEEIRRNSAAPRGPGALTLSSYEKFIILQLCIEEPSRSLSGYREWLYHLTGKESAQAQSAVFSSMVTSMKPI